MKTKNKVKLAVFIAAGLVPACGALQTKNKNQKASQTVMSLNGQWESPCQKQDWFDFSQAIERYTFSALGDFEAKNEIFRDDCKTADNVVELAGTYASLGKDASAPDAKDINFTVSTATMIPKSDVAVKMLNAMKYCSVQDWTLDKKVDILNKECVGINYKNGEVVFNIYRQNSDQLYLGRKMFPLAADSASARPNKVDEERIFAKKK